MCTYYYDAAAVRNTYHRMFTVIVIGLMMLCGSVSLTHAVDGVIEINQARVNAGGITPNDTPGFPVTIDFAPASFSSSTSFRLTGSLSVGCGSDLNKNAIEINWPGITVDLNGFSIIGCGATSGGNGLSSTFGIDDITVINGEIAGFKRGIDIKGRAVIKMVKAINNNKGGIYTGGESIVTGSVARNNGATPCASKSDNTADGHGVSVGFSSIVSKNHSTRNTCNGIIAGTSSNVTDNVANLNVSGNGIYASPGSTVTGNTTINNDEGIFAGLGSAVIGNSAGNNSGFGLTLGLPSAGIGFSNNVLFGTVVGHP